MLTLLGKPIVMHLNKSEVKFKMIRPNYRYFRRRSLVHSAKGSEWEEHKYIKRVDGNYYYPDSYDGGRHISDLRKVQEIDNHLKSESKSEEKIPDDKETESSEKRSLSSEDIEKLANEVIRGTFGNGAQRKELLGENYAEIQKKVNEILLGNAGSKKVSEATSESISIAEEAAKNATKKVNKSSSSSTKGIDIDKVLSVYKEKKVK